MSEDIYIDVNYLTESERDIILQVLAKDEELRKQEKRRISTLKNELDQIKKNGASREEIETSRICARCRSPLGLIINSGALCPKCEARVCKDCRNMTSYSWLCILCAKIREVRAESGAWFFEQERRKADRPQLYGSALVRASFRRAKPTSQAGNGIKDGDPGSPPVITLNLNNHGRLHRPVPVHMSRLAEKDGEEEEDKGEERENVVEINQNYQQYVKATRVPRKPEEEQHDPDEQEKGSSSSATSTPRGSPVNVLDSDVFEVADQEETVFEHLKNGDHHKIEVDEEAEEGATEQEAPELKADVTHGDAIANGYSVEEAQGYEEKVKDWRNDREEESAHIDQQPKDHPVVEVKTKWHEVADEWGGTGDSYDQPAPDSYLHKQLLTVRSVSPDSETTGEFFTPLTTPMHSGTGTPVLSDYGQSEGMGSSSDVFEDAGDATPVEGDRTPVSELEKDDVDNIGDVTVTNPEIKCTSPDIAEPEGHRTPTQDDDIDQAFAMYEKDHPGTKSLKEQLTMLSMGSRESIVSYYSDAGEGRFGNVAVTGEVLFGLKYNKHKHQLEVQVHRAKDIAAADEKKGRSDPYVKVYLLPDKTKGGKRKTKTKKNTLNPDFDEILTFKIGFEEMVTRTLWLAMWNHDTFGHNDFLGEVMLPLETHQESGFSWDDPSPNCISGSFGLAMGILSPLRVTKIRTMARPRISPDMPPRSTKKRPEPSLMSYCGDLTVSMMYEPGDESNKDKKKKKKSGGKLHIQLKGARNLRAKDSNGFSDPFCKSYLLPDTSKKTKHKTAVVKKNLNPVWNHSFCYENQTIDELRNRVLELTVWDFDRGSSNDFLGGLRLGLGNKTEPWDDSEGLEIEAWQMMLDRPNKWHEYTLNLRSSMDSQIE